MRLEFSPEDGSLMFGMLLGIAASIGGERQRRILDALRRLFPQAFEATGTTLAPTREQEDMPCDESGCG